MATATKTPVATDKAAEKAALRAAKKAERKAAREKAKKEKAKRVPFLAEGADLITTEVIEGFDRKVHLPLKKKDFASEDVYFKFKALAAQKTAEKFQKQADEAAALGSSKDRARKKRLLSYLEKVESLKEELEKENVDIDAFLAAAGK